MAMKLNEARLIQEVIENIPVKDGKFILFVVLLLVIIC